MIFPCRLKDLSQFCVCLYLKKMASQPLSLTLTVYTISVHMLLTWRGNVTINCAKAKTTVASLAT